MLEHIQKLTQIRFLRGENLTNDLSCLMFVLFLLISQCLFVKMVDAQVKSNKNDIHKVEYQHDLINY